jgi:hypothetical protein
MQSGRELWKVELPFNTNANKTFALECLKQGVKELKKIKIRGS